MEVPSAFAAFSWKPLAFSEGFYENALFFFRVFVKTPSISTWFCKNL